MRQRLIQPRRYGRNKVCRASNFHELASIHSLSTLRTRCSALQYSVVWYDRALAKRVGRQRMKHYVTTFGYGNQGISSGLHSPQLIRAFWLNSSLRISADEQIEFLKRFYASQLPVAKRTTAIVKDILVLEKTPRYTLSAVRTART